MIHDHRAAIRAAISALEKVAVCSDNLPSGEAPIQSLADQAAVIHRARARRAKLFGHESLFGEAAYDILLDLYVWRARKKPVSITSACCASGVPPTTALRHIAKLESLGFLRRCNDPDDSRRAYLELTDFAVERLELHLMDQFTK